MSKRQEKIRIVIVGNGFGGIYTLKGLHKYFCGNPDIEISLIGEKNYFLFTPLLHEVATGGINPENIIEPIRKVLGCCVDSFYLGRAEMVNLEARTVQVGKEILPYDYLVLATGATTNFYGTPGAAEHSFTLKSLEDAIKIKNRAILQMERASHMPAGDARKKALTFSIVGGGPTGVEMAAELQELIQENFYRYYSREIIQDCSVVLIHRDKELLPQFGPKVRTRALDYIKKKGIVVRLESEVSEVGTDYVLINNNEKLESETIIWVAGVKPAKINFDKDVAATPDGKLLVTEYLTLTEHENVFALGDGAAFKVKGTEKLLPALAQVAEKQASMLAQNIYLAVKNKKMKPFVYKHTASLISLGQWMAIGEVSKFTFSGHITWWIWRTVYLFKMLSFRKKFKVAVDWTINIFYPRDISEF